MRRILVSLGLLLSLAVAAAAAAQPATKPDAKPPEPPVPVTYRAQVGVIAGDQTTLQVTKRLPGVSPEKWESVSLTVGKDARAAVKELHPGDLVRITLVSKEGSELKSVVVEKAAVPFRRILATVAVVAAVLWLLTWLACRGTGWGMSRFIVGRDNRYSKSKFQIAIWFATVVVVYLAALYLRWLESVPSLVGGVDIPQNLLLLSGISALSFATAKGITQGKENNPATPSKPRADKPRFADLVSDDSGQPDLGDFQMVIITVIAVGVYLVQAFSFLSLLEMSAQVSIPNVDQTLLGIFGISHGAYLTKKAVSGDDGARGAGGGGQQQAPQPQAGGQPQAAAQPQAGQAGPV